MMHNERVL